jgi:hypothetical protein
MIVCNIRIAGYLQFVHRPPTFRKLYLFQLSGDGKATTTRLGPLGLALSEEKLGCHFEDRVG